MLSKIQKEIVETDKEKVVVVAAPASGKTRVLTERVKYLLEHGADPNKLVVITFTNAAAEEMRERIGDIGKDCFIGTIHSYAFRLLLLGGYVDEAVGYAVEENFDYFFRTIKENLECVKEVDYLLLDEAQDSNENQFEFILDIINPKSFFIVGDARQSIYRFAGGRPDMLLRLSHRSDVTKYDLNENYRNGLYILEFAKRIINRLGGDYVDNSVAMCKTTGRVYESTFSPYKFAEYIVNSNDSFGDWFVLCRSNSMVEYMMNYLKDRGIPCDTFKKGDLSSGEFSKRMKANTVKVLTVHSAKGLEAKNVIVIGVNFGNDEERRVCYVAATRAKKLLVWCISEQGNRNKKKKQTTRLESWE